MVGILFATWANFDYPNRAFQDWCQSPIKGKLPNIGPNTRINCWEILMYAAVVSGQLTPAVAGQIYRDCDNTTKEALNAWLRQIPDLLAPSGRRGYNPGEPPQRGELVFWDGHEHVAMATGRIDDDGSPEVYTFWPPPDKRKQMVCQPIPERPGESGWATKDRVKVSTIKELTEDINNSRVGQPQVVVEIGFPVWKEQP
jgi:hypothetical protein